MYTEPLQRFTIQLESGLNALFSQRYNPFYYHGALPNFFIWVLYLTGLLLFAYYVPTLAQAYDSVSYITQELAFGNVFRTLHRYAADGMMLFVMLHLFRVWFTDRYREYRILPWITGVILLSVTFLVGLTGYFMIWDQEAVNLTYMTINFLNALPVVGAPIVEFMLAGKVVSDYTLTRFLFLHLGIPLLLMFLLWMHYIRITRPVNVPPLALNLILLGALFLFSGAVPVTLGIQPELNETTQSARDLVMNFDLFFAWPQYLLSQGWATTPVWLLFLAVPVGLLLLPYIQKKSLRGQYAQVIKDNCTGCQLCYHDCPYEAITMVDRGNDGSRFKRLAVVDAGRCANCGLCVGACAFKAIEIPRRGTAGVLEEIELALA
ncbi:MAG: cytochrome b N-terminal domain-containing protein [Vampirovibrionales bacterium]|nr:cytochrome b N-terminal domain-containing protein [Vampirovibrionales bacterium]